MLPMFPLKTLLARTQTHAGTNGKRSKDHNSHHMSFTIILSPETLVALVPV